MQKKDGGGGESQRGGEKGKMGQENGGCARERRGEKGKNLGMGEQRGEGGGREKEKEGREAQTVSFISVTADINKILKD